MSRLLPLLLLALLATVSTGCAPAAENAPPAGSTPAARPVPTANPTAALLIPVRVRIPDIGVDSAVVPIGVDAAGALQPPESTGSTGWYAAGPSPGASGPAVLAGHVDSRLGPAVFYRLRELPTGARIEIDRSDGTTATFVTRATIQTAKATRAA